MLIVYLVFIFIFSMDICKIHAVNNEESIIYVSNWDELKQKIEESNVNSNIEIHLRSDEESLIWEAASTLIIPQDKTVTLIADSDITIKRLDDFTEDTRENSKFVEDSMNNHGALIETWGTLNINTSSENKTITLDGATTYQVNYSLIDVRLGNININNMVIKDNVKQGGHGGGLKVNKTATGSNIKISNVEFINNTANYGGAIFIDSRTCNTILDNVVIKDNKAIVGSGGGIYAWGNLEIRGNDTLISSNSAATYAGGIMVKSNCILNDGTIMGNQALKNSGGGISVDGTLTYNGGTITGNMATKGKGGGISYTSLKGGIINNLGDPEVIKRLTENVKFNIASTNNDIEPEIASGKNQDWTGDPKIKKTDVDLFKTYERANIELKMQTQGMTVTDKYIVFTLYYATDGKVKKIAVADKNNGEIIGLMDAPEGTGHGNDMAWDSDEDKFYLLTSGRKIYKFGISVEGQSVSMTDLEEFNSSVQFSAIAYDKDNSHFIGKNKTEMYIVDKDFKVLSSFSFKDDFSAHLTSQGMGYYNGYIYFCCTETGQISNTQQLFFNNKEKMSNVIYKYSLDGTLVQAFYIPNTTLYGEIESCAFDDQGKLFASYVMGMYKNENNEMVNTLKYNNENQLYAFIPGEYSDVINFYNIDVHAPILEVKYSTTETTNQDVIVTISSNEPLKGVNGWKLSADKKTLTRIYSENAQENIEIANLSGNVSIASIDIKNIKKEDNTPEDSNVTEDKVTSNKIDKIDNPNTGDNIKKILSISIISMILLVGCVIISTKCQKNQA